MTKVDIFSGFLGSGKTTLIKKLIAEAYGTEKLVLIENEFGEIGVDSTFLSEAGVQITEMNSGCICCSLVGDFGRALQKVIDDYAPERILIEPSGVGKLSDVIRAVEDIHSDEIELNSFTTVVDAKKCKMYMKNFGEFFNNQVEHAGTIILSHTAGMSEAKLAECVAMLREKNPDATIVTTDWDELDGAQILAAMEKKSTLHEEMEHMMEETHHHHHHHDHDNGECDCHHHHHDHDHDHDHDDDDEECECHHHHHDHECEGEECECHHHHHDHEHECDDPECECHHHHEHEHHHDHEHECDDPECGCHHHHGEHHHHHADEVFTSWGRETARVYSNEEITAILEALENESEYGMVLRAKGVVPGKDGWIHFDYVPGTPDVRPGGASVTGRVCVIGSKLREENIAKLFGIA